MKCLSVRIIAPSLLLVSTVLSPIVAWSMDAMTDNQLSATTGQDGVTLLIDTPKLAAADVSAGVTRTNGLVVGAVVLHDKDGFTGNTSAGALVFGDAKQANALNSVGTQFGLYASAPIAVKIDASNGKVTSGLGGTKPVLNVNVALPSDLMIRTGDIALDVSNRNGIAVGSLGATNANAAIGGTAGRAYKILNSMDIALGSALTLNLQLGNPQQGSMITFGNFIIPSLTVNVGVASPNCQYVANVCTPSVAVPASSLSLTAKVMNLDLSGLVVDAVSDLGLAMTGTASSVGGLLFRDASVTVGGLAASAACGGAGTSACGLALNNVIAGDITKTSTSIGAGLLNAPLGSFGVTNMTVTNLKIGVSGM